MAKGKKKTKPDVSTKVDKTDRLAWVNDVGTVEQQNSMLRDYITALHREITKKQTGVALVRSVLSEVYDAPSNLFVPTPKKILRGKKDEEIAVQTAGVFLVGEGPRLLGHIENIYKASGGPFVTGKNVIYFSANFYQRVINFLF